MNASKYILITLALGISNAHAINFAKIEYFGDVDIKNLKKNSVSQAASGPITPQDSAATPPSSRIMPRRLSGYGGKRNNTMTGRIHQNTNGRELLRNFTLGYYQQFLGPTLGGPANETYNVFQEGRDLEGTGRAPLQSFHALNLRYKINNDWGLGASVAMANGYTDEVKNKGGVTNRPDAEFFNVRTSVYLPDLATPIGRFFTSLALELPTSEISREDNMQWGWVAAQSLAFNLPSLKWSAGMNYQLYRLHYRDNQKGVVLSNGARGRPTQLQTMIISGGPYLNYRMNDNWQYGSNLILDWDQRGVQEGSREFNNNLPHRVRLSATYFPMQMKYLSSVGVFTQSLVKFRTDTTAMGGEFAMRF